VVNCGPVTQDVLAQVSLFRIGCLGLWPTLSGGRRGNHRRLSHQLHPGGEQVPPGGHQMEELLRVGPLLSIAQRRTPEH